VQKGESADCTNNRIQALPPPQHRSGTITADNATTTTTVTATTATTATIAAVASTTAAVAARTTFNMVESGG
jgi:hypothetical protein